MKEITLSTSFGIILAAAISLSSANAKTWVDVTGKHKIEGEFVSLADGRVTLKSPSGRITTLPLEKLSAADQAFAKSQAGDSGEMKVTATAKVQKWSKHDTFKVQVEFIGGLAATAYSVGPFKADPVSVGGKQIKPERQFGSGRFKVIDRSKKGIFSEHPKGGVRVEIEYETPKGTENIGKVTGTVKVLAGGTAKEVVLQNLLTRPDAAIKDPILTAKGLIVKFKRKTTDKGGLQLETSMAVDSKGFVRLEMVGVDGKPVKGVGRASYAGGKGMTYVVTAKKEALKSATLKLLFRDGAKEVELPFTVESVKVIK